MTTAQSTKWYKRRVHPGILLGIFVLEMTLTGYLIFFFYKMRVLNSTLTAQVISSSELITQKVEDCFRLPFEEREACAEEVGRSIAILFPSPQEQIRECMKFRPVFVRYCQKGLGYFP